MRQIYTVDKTYKNTRFDKWFKAKIIDIPQSLIEKILRQNKVKINRKKLNPHTELRKEISLRSLIYLSLRQIIRLR